MEGGEPALAVPSKEGAPTLPAAPVAAPASLPTPNLQGGAPSGEDGGRLAVGAQAKEAATLFHAGHYSECLAILQQLLLKNENDLKIQHNIAIAEFYRDGCSEPQKLLDSLNKLKSLASSDRQSKIEEVTRVPEEQAEFSGTSSGSPRSSTAGGSARTVAAVSTPSTSGSTPSSTETLAPVEDYDTSTIMINTAVILFHMRQYARSLSILEPLYRNIEPIEEIAALQICQLMLDITLLSGQPAKAATVLQYMEKVFGYLLSSGDSGASTQAQTVAPSAPQSIAAAPPPLGPTESSNVTSSSTSVASSLIASPSGETGLTRTSSEEVLDDEVLSIELEMGGSHGVRAASLPKPIPRASGVQKPSPASVELKLAMHLYKVRLLLLTRNLKGVKREVKSALNLSRDNLPALMLKAQLEYARGNYKKAIKILTSCNSRDEGIPSAMFLSNLGCIHHRMHKDHVASLYFLKALQSCPHSTSEKSVDLISFSQDKSLSILYNAGLQRLTCGDPMVASSCFQEAACFYYNQPVLWLRLAECTLVALENGQLDAPAPAFPSKREELRVCIVGDGKLRRVILPSGSLNPTLKHSGSWDPVLEDVQSISAEDSEQSLPYGKPHKLSMTFARQCLRNALFLLTRLQTRANEASPELKEIEEGNGGATNSVSGLEQATEPKGMVNGSIGQINVDGDGKEGKLGAGVTGSIASSIAAYEEERRREHASLRQLVLANLAYVELCLENPVVALATARTMLAQPDGVKTLTFLAHMYAAEALCMLDRTKEAAEHLSKCMEESNMAETSSNIVEDDGAHKWRSGDNSEASVDGDDVANSDAPTGKPSGDGSGFVDLSRLTGGRARAALYVNLAAVYIMQGELEQAYQWATQAVSLAPGSPAATLALVFVHLSRGQTEEAVTLLKTCRSLYVTPKAGYWPRVVST